MRPLLTWLRIIAAGLMLTLLGACSTLRMGYNQAPNLLYWWVDGYADMTDAQSAQLRQDIDRLLVWHRETELSRYADLLRRWQGMAMRDMTAEESCRQVDELRSAWLRLLDQGAPALARLALTLDDAQVAHLQRHQLKGQQGFEKDFLRGTPQALLKRRTDRLRNRYETLYGRLTPAQEALVLQGIMGSPFDPAQALQERQRRDEELLQLIGQWQERPPGPAREAQVSREIAEWIASALPPAQATGHRNAPLIRHGCTQHAALHNSTSPRQRAHAVKVLQTYEADLRALSRQN